MRCGSLWELRVRKSLHFRMTAPSAYLTNYHGYQTGSYSGVLAFLRLFTGTCVGCLVDLAQGSFEDRGQWSTMLLLTAYWTTVG